MKHIGFPPFKPQYFFPENFREYSIFLSFYKPYTLAGVLAWWTWRNFGILHSFCNIKDLGDYLPEKSIRSVIERDAIMAFNLGTPGPEQKITAIGINGDKRIFVKYAESNSAKVNVSNEGFILGQLGNFEFAPQLLERHSDGGQEVIVTTFLEGERLSAVCLNNSILSLLYKLRQISINTQRKFTCNLINSFAHGDFCPWNLMRVDGELKAFDWEMAGYYPLGYDLFTYIFQTSFLIHPKRKIENILEHNLHHIKSYFGNKNWKEYLSFFAEKKLEIESQKNNMRLVPHYRNLYQYAKES